MAGVMTSQLWSEVARWRYRNIWALLQARESLLCLAVYSRSCRQWEFCGNYSVSNGEADGSEELPHC